MGKYCVRYCNKAIKGTSKAKVKPTVDDEEDMMDEESAAEVAGTEKTAPPTKMKMGTPEKDVVAKVFGVKNKPKK